MQNAKLFMDLFGEKNGPSIIMTYDVYKNNYIAARQRGCKIRLITEITKGNLQYCKELLKIVSEMRRLEGFVGGYSSKRIRIYDYHHSQRETIVSTSILQ